ncbi:hypothetical protein IAT38_001001 [Cryptococcus sp. DSM 104549]
MSTYRRERVERYIPFNHDPRNVGTRSGILMPQNPRRLANGFEDPDEWFRSPENNKPAAISAIMNKASRTPSGRAGFNGGEETPGTGRRVTRRMSELDVEEQEGSAAEDLLRDDDDLAAATPGSFFPGSEPSSVALPTRSRLPLASPSTHGGYDAIPSPSLSSPSRTRPSRSPRKSMLGPSTSAKSARITSGSSSKLAAATASGDEITPPRRSTRVSALITPPGPEDTTLDELDTMGSSSARRSSRGPRLSGSTNKSPVKLASPAMAAAALAAEDEVDDEAPSVKHGKGRGKANGNGKVNGRGGSVEDETRENADLSGSDNEPDNGADYSYGDEGGLGNYDDGPSMDQMDDGPMPLDEDDGWAAARAEAGEDEEGSDDAEMEERAMAEAEAGGLEDDEGSNEEDEEERSPPKTKQAARKAAAAKEKKEKAAAAKRNKEKEPSQRVARAGSVAAKPKRTRISQIGAGSQSPERDNGATRRSSRQHFKPLEYWRGERFEWEPGPGLAVIKEVVTYPEEQPQPFAARRHRGGAKNRARSGSAAAEETGGKKKKGKGKEVEEGNLEDGWDDKTEPTGLVLDFPTGEECFRKIAMPNALLNPKLVQGGRFKYQKVFGEGHFMATGVVYIPIGSKKNLKPSKDNSYVFFVICGAVQVTIYRTSFVIAPGGQFLVPRGNDYCIENISPDKEAQLFFAQARKIRVGEDELEEAPRGGSASATQEQVKESQSQSHGKGKGKRKALEAVHDNGEDAEEQEVEATPKSSRKKKGRK